MQEAIGAVIKTPMTNNKNPLIAIKPATITKPKNDHHFLVTSFLLSSKHPKTQS